MTLKTAALIAALAQTGGLVMTIVVAAMYSQAQPPLLLLSTGVHILAQAAAAAFFALYYAQPDEPSDPSEAIPVYRLDGEQEPQV